MSELVVVERAEVVPTLNELAKTINAEHESAEASIASAVDHALRAGDALIQARSSMRNGWKEWCAEHLDLSSSTISRYIRFATFKEIVRDAPSQEAARRMLMDGGHRKNPENARKDFDRETAERLREAGWSWENTASIMGVSKGFLIQNMIPMAREKARTASKLRRQKRASARKVVERQRRAEAAEKAGGGLNNLFKAIRRAQIEANNFSETGDTPEKRQAATIAYRIMCRAEDEIAKILADA